MTNIIEFYNLHRKNIIYFFIFIIFGTLCFVGVYFFNTMKIKADSITSELEEKDKKVTEEENLHLSNLGEDSNENSQANNTLKVDIKGMVKKPGIYELSVGSRIEDVIQKSGGLLTDADTSIINLSKKLIDEMVIIIYSKDELKNFSDTIKEKEKKIDSCNDLNEQLVNGACIKRKDLKDEKQSTNENSSSNITNLININVASVDELTSLDGIGEAKAKAIIEYRTINGNFKNIEDIKKVDGIGDTVFEKIKDNITV